MAIGRQPKLNPKKKYLQVALNNTLNEAFSIIKKLPASDRIILEAGTPLIKRYGEEGIRKIKNWYAQHMVGALVFDQSQVQKKKQMTGFDLIKEIYKQAKEAQVKTKKSQANFQNLIPYVVADLKMMDRGDTEVEIASRAGADAAVALGHAPIESLDAFIDRCEELDLDSMIDMINVEYPLNVLTQLKKQPTVVILHRGVDEEHYNKEKMLPLHEIRRIKGRYDVMIAVAGGDTPREVQSAAFNDADIVVVWKDFYSSDSNTANLVEEFLREIK